MSAESKHRVFVGGGQFALRCGPHWMGVRSSRMQELWSERNRIGWRIVYLPFGMRVFYRKDVPLRYPVEPQLKDAPTNENSMFPTQFEDEIVGHWTSEANRAMGLADNEQPGSPNRNVRVGRRDRHGYSSALPRWHVRRMNDLRQTPIRHCGLQVYTPWFWVQIRPPKRGDLDA